MTTDTDFAVRRSIRIAAPIEKVWPLVSEPAQISRWFGQTALEGTVAGAHGTVTFPGRDPMPVRLEAVDAPHSISFRWNNDDALGSIPAELDEATSTVFTFTLEAVDGGTELTVLETGFDRTSDAAANMAAHTEGWTTLMDAVAGLVGA